MLKYEWDEHKRLANFTMTKSNRVDAIEWERIRAELADVARIGRATLP